MNPSHELGWFRRKKSDHFHYYNIVAEELCHILQIDPWTFTVKTEVAEVDFSDVASIEKLAQQVQKFLDKQKELKIYKGDPVVFVKNNRGTYGMGILSVHSGEELLQLNAKERKKMGYSKGGGEVHDVIIQEGIPTEVQIEGETAEPVIYLIGCQLAGGFLRTHKEKGPTENLNSPGAVFKRLCMSDLMVDVEGTPLENVYGTVARMNGLAIGLEARAIGVKYSLE
jgi:glutamate--cysteine ligase